MSERRQREGTYDTSLLLWVSRERYVRGADRDAPLLAYRGLVRDDAVGRPVLSLALAALTGEVVMERLRLREVVPLDQVLGAYDPRPGHRKVIPLEGKVKGGVVVRLGGAR